MNVPWARALCCLASAFGALGVSFAQSTIRVPADKPTIQSAILSASNGDTILVSPGTYRERINFSKKAITVRSVAGPEVTILDGGNQPPAVVSFNQGELSNSVLQGFTIQNGAGDEGGGITIQNSSPSILSNRIVNNSGCNGAGIGVGFGSPLIQGNTISNNVSRCAGLGGGGILFRGDSSGRVLNNVITGNFTNTDGGGVNLWAGGAVTLRDNIITGNTAGGTGGGIATVNSAPAIIVGNLIAGNEASGAGGLSFSNPPAALVNNTIAFNRSIRPAAPGIVPVSGLQTGFSPQTRIVGNLIIAADGQSAVACGTFGVSPISGNFKNNDVYSIGVAPYDSNCVDQTGAAGNISADPRFLNPAAGNYRLHPASPAINAGDPTAPELAATDLDAAPRLRAGKVDMGAYQYPGPTTATLSASNLAFPQQAVGSSSAVQAITIANTGAAALQFASVDITGDFSRTTTCPAGAGLPPAASCIVAVTFTPTARGTRQGTLTISANTAASPISIPLTGNATGAAITFSANTLTFPNQPVNTPGDPLSLTITNAGDSRLTISRISTSAEFSQTNTCDAGVATGATCSVSVTFQPVASGTRTGSLTVTSNAVGGPHTVILVGNGQAPVPVLTSLSPENVDAGSAPFTLTVLGANFIANSVVRWNGVDRPTTFVSSARLTAVIPASDLANGGSFPVSVFNPPPSGGSSSALPLIVNNRPPALTSISPSSALVGAPAFQLTVNGSNFVAASVVRWNGNERPTTFVSPNQLRAAISAVDISFTSTSQVTVFSPQPGGGESNSATFAALVPSPAPALSSISPTSVTAGSPAFALTVSGSGFTPTSIVRWNQQARPTTFVSETELQASISAADIASGASVAISVVNPAPGGGTSAPLLFTIAGNPRPFIISLSPAAVFGGDPLSLTVNGIGFASDSVVRWNGADRPTTFVSASQLIAAIPAADTAVLGSARVSVFNSPPGGGLSFEVSLPIAANPTPSIASLIPASITAGATGQVLRIYGNGFTSTSLVRWNGQDRPVTPLDSSTLNVRLSDADVAAPGLAEIRVFNRPLGGGASQPVWLPITIALSANSLAWDKTRGLLFASVPSSQPRLGNSVVSIDPSTGAIGQPIFVGSEPGKIALSDDGRYLYVALDAAGAVRRVDLVSQTAELQFSLGAESNGTLYVEDMQVMPANPRTVAISRRYIGISPRHAGVGIYDDGVPRKNFTQTHTGSNRIEFSSSPSTLYGFNNESTEFGLRVLRVDESGVREITVHRSSPMGGFGVDMKFAGGLLFSTTGAVLDPENGNLLGRFSFPDRTTGFAIAPDASLGRSFVLLGAFGSETSGIAVYNNATFLPIGTLTLPRFTGNAAGDDVMIRWGDDGLAVRTAGQILLFRSSSVKPPSVSAAGIVNAGGLTPGPVAPGSIVSLFGAGIATRESGALSAPLPDSLSGMQVSLNSVPAPLFYAGPSQVNFQVPWDLAGQPNVELSVGGTGFNEQPVKISLVPAAPGIFTVGAPDSQAIAVIAGTVDLAAPAGFVPGSRPARRGDYLTIYCTGLGPVTNQPPTGAASPAGPLAETTAQPAVTIGGVNANVTFSGLAPGLVGVYQINVEVPPLPPSPAAPVVVTIGGATSNRPTIAVQ